MGGSYRIAPVTISHSGQAQYRNGPVGIGVVYSNTCNIIFYNLQCRVLRNVGLCIVQKCHKKHLPKVSESARLSFVLHSIRDDTISLGG